MVPDRLQPGGSAYNVPLALAAEGRLQAGRMAAVLSAVVRRHEVLRTVFAEHDGLPVQVVLPAAPVALPVVDLRGLPGSRPEEEARRLASEEAVRPFDLAAGPLLRCVLLDLAPERSLLVLNLHHIVTDGWSMGVLVREVNALYSDPAGGETLPELAVQYADFAVWQRRWLTGEVLEQQTAWWRERLRGAPAVLELTADHPRPPVQTQRGGDHRLDLDAGLSRRILELARQEGVTPFMVLAGGLFALFSRLTGQADLTLGSPIANRNRIETEALIGFFVNTLVLRADLSRAPSFRELLRQVREVSLGAYAHQDVPFEKLVDELQPDRDLSHAPLFQVVLALQNAPLPRADLGEVRLVPEEISTAEAKLDLAFAFVEEGGRFAGLLQYTTDLFEPATAARYARYFAVMLDGLVSRPREPLAEAPLLTAEERQQTLREWNDTAVEAAEGGLLEGIVARAALAPEAPAVVQGGRVLTWGELLDRASRLAGELREMGIGSAVRTGPVGICVERSPEMVIGALAVVLAGGAYLPLDPAHPEDRLAFEAQESRMPVLLVRGGEVPSWAGPARVLRLDLPSGSRPVEPLPADPDRLAYVIYTSGSTGRPKGVQLTLGGLETMVRWHLSAFGTAAGDRATLVASPAFDASVFEIWPCLAAGASLHIPEEEVRLAPDLLLDWLASAGITLSFMPTPLAEQVVQAAEREVPAGLRLRALLVGGDRLQRAPHKPLPFLLVNMYGPSENSVVATWTVVEPGSARPPAIGRPIAGTRAYVVDGRLAPVPAGISGELVLGGAGLAAGYVDRPGLTAEKFVPDPFGQDGGRLYRTGDRARYLGDGNLEFLSRIDHQVKIRGYRIELGEIEAALVRHPTVREAVVAAREDVPGEKRLVGYIVPHRQPAPATFELRAFLQESLPEYMVPWVFVELDVPAGDGQRQARPGRPAGAAGGPAPRPRFVPPRNDLERAIAEVWREVLGLEEVGVRESFFEAGGSSLLLARLQRRLRQSLGREIPFVDLFRHPTIESLAQSLGGEAPRPEEKAAQRAGPHRHPPRVDAAAPGDAAESEMSDAGRIAIVGIAGRFPGARDAGELWRNLRDGVESITFFSDEELAAARRRRRRCSRDPRYVRAERRARRRRPLRRRLLRLHPARGRGHGPAAPRLPGVRLGGPGGRRLRPRARSARPDRRLRRREHEHATCCQPAARRRS